MVCYGVAWSGRVKPMAVVWIRFESYGHWSILVRACVEEACMAMVQCLVSMGFTVTMKNICQAII